MMNLLTKVKNVVLAVVAWAVMDVLHLSQLHARLVAAVAG